MEGKGEKQNRAMRYHNSRRERKPKKQAHAALRMDDFGYGRTGRNSYLGGIVNVGRTAPHCQQEAREQTAQSRRTLNRGSTREAAGPPEISGRLFSRLTIKFSGWRDQGEFDAFAHGVDAFCADADLIA
jgi:hypothetical protein